MRAFSRRHIKSFSTLPSGRHSIATSPSTSIRVVHTTEGETPPAVQVTRAQPVFSAAHPDFIPLDAGETLAQLKVAQATSLCSGGETGSAYLRMWPHRHQTDGFFAAVWTRKD